MTVLEAAILGAVQGVFMFLPVSSTAHLVITQHWLIAQGGQLPPPESDAMILFDLILHVGTLASIAVVFWRPLKRLVADGLGQLAAWLAAPRGRWPWQAGLALKLGLLGLLTVAVTGTVGLMVREPLKAIFASPLAIAGTLAFTALILWLSDVLPVPRRSLRRTGPVTAGVIGIAQALALTPGLSRSALTMTAALFCGMKRRWAAEYSFFVAIPTILAASAVQGLDVSLAGGLDRLGVLPVLVGTGVSALVGIAALKLVVALLYRAQLKVFSVYLAVLAALVAGGVVDGLL